MILSRKYIYKPFIFCFMNIIFKIKTPVIVLRFRELILNYLALIQD